MVLPKGKPKFSQAINVLELLGQEPGSTEAILEVPYKIARKDGTILRKGVTNSKGESARFFTAEKEDVVVYIGEGEWSVHIDVEHKTVAAGDQGDEL